MEKFAHHYCEMNPSIFKNPDTCFVVSFAIIMLNTSLHNPAVKEKQTLEQFIKMNRGIDNGDDLPRELLEVRFYSFSQIFFIRKKIFWNNLGFLNTRFY